ncbi:MAG: 4Fe-4S dicluster domain-containing protein [Promethearchaeota archaeon]|nr:MAG: 4Fe-4S dicluster domain-containing protein [Candidatus Lokiarchaeota archaeon]
MTEAKQVKKVVRKIIEIDEDLCTGCGKCVTSCAEGALAIIDGKAKVINDVFCDGLGACIGECPEDALRIIEREAAEFDEEAVEEYLEKLKENKSSIQQSTHSHQCNCPSSQPMVFEGKWEETEITGDIPSALRQWPTKLTLVNPNAPYFNNKELVIASDCSPFAYGDFHRKILRGKPLVTVCPMLGLGEVELEKLEQILKLNPIENIQLVLMEVPCCQKINMFLDPILQTIGRKIFVEKTIIGRDGSIIKSQNG